MSLLFIFYTDIPGEYHERDETTINGQVTHLYQEYGLIDGYIYFAKESVKSGHSLKVCRRSVM